MAPPHRPPPRTASVLAKRQITPNMLRITLGGPGMANFPVGSEGGYIKLRLTPQGPGGPAVVRTYTIRRQQAGTIDVDFALHTDAGGKTGPATCWAMTCQIGDTIEIGGPGPAKPLPDGHDFYLVAGDMTALPAIAVNLEQLPANAIGYCVIEVQSEADRQDLLLPSGFALDFVINAVPGTGAAAMLAHLRAAAPQVGEIYAWVASEFETMRALRNFLRGELQLGRGQLYISSYWKAGLTEDDHKRIKSEDAALTDAG
jgi:NADPH-dependent ferric siderophore reductase